jgi:hypothetical protein
LAQGAVIAARDSDDPTVLLGESKIQILVVTTRKDPSPIAQQYR